MAKGKPTARSQNYLRQYGYPSARELRREAQGLASASVPTVRSVQRPYERQLQSSRDFLAAVQAALRDTSAQVGTGYDTAIAQSQGVDQAAQQRLASLGLTPEAAVAQAGGDNATQNLIANSAAAKNYAAQLPGIAAGQAYVGQQGINKNLTDALANRRDQLSQAFFQALQQVQGQALQQASFNQQAQAQQQNLALQYAQMGQQQAQYEQSRRDSRHQFTSSMIAQYGYDPTTGKFLDQNQAGVTALAKKYGLTSNEVFTMQGHASDQVQGLLAQGYPWKQALAQAEQHVPPEIARLAVMSVYGGGLPPAPGLPPALRKAQTIGHQQGVDYVISHGTPYALTDWQKYQTQLAHYQAAQQAVKGFNTMLMWRSIKRALKSPRSQFETRRGYG